MEDRVENRIADAKLLRKDRVILDYMLQNKRMACFQTSNEIAETLGVSPSSVVRLSGKLGYENFAALKRALQREVTGAGDASLPDAIPYDKVDDYESLADEEILATFTRGALSDIKAVITAENERKLIEIADIVVAARRVYIAGFRASQGFASAFGVMLSCMRPGVIVVGQSHPVIESLLDAAAEDLMLAISFKRYSKDAVFAVRMAREAGCPVVAMTDSYTSPVAEGATRTLVHRASGMSVFDSHLTLLMNMEKILLLVSKRNKKTNERRLLKMEKYLKETGQY